MRGLVDMNERFSRYDGNYRQTWLDRFVWCGLNGDMPNHATSITNYFKDSEFVSVIPIAKDAKKFHKIISDIADDYVLWCNSKDVYTKDENEAQRNFFLGSIGEMFFCNLINDLHRILIPNKHNGDFEIYEFRNIAPRFADECDYGVDLTGEISYRNEKRNCAVQVKFWNPESSTSFITNAIISGVCSDAMCNGYVSQFEDNNIVLCWLGCMDRLTLHLKRNAQLFRHMIIIDYKVLDANINGQNPGFWKRMRDSLYEIKEF